MPVTLLALIIFDLCSNDVDIPAFAYTILVIVYLIYCTMEMD